MRCALWCTAIFAVGFASMASAQVHTFPYEAVVATDNVPVHSGPGYYATNRLAKGDRVTVHRHDPGGWFMIAPPAGEFSLIAADAIQPTGPGIAEIVADEVTARIGSRITPEHNVEQVPLVRGDRVRLVDGGMAPSGWVAIEPPRGEFRWIPGKYLVPVRADIRAQQDADPFAIPSSAKPPEVAGQNAIAARQNPADARPERPEPLDNAVTTTGANSSGNAVKQRVEPNVEHRVDTLSLLDRELEGLMLTEPTQWPLEELAAEYGRLKTTHAVSARQIDVRLAQIERMRMVRERYTDYVQLTSATDERDAALVAQAAAIGTGQVVQAAKPVSPGSPVKLSSPVMPADAVVNTANRDVPTGPPPAPLPEPVAESTPPGGIAPGAVTVMPRTMSAQRPAPSASSGGPILMAPDTPSNPPAAVHALPQQAAMPQRPSAKAGEPQRFDAVGVIQKAVEPHPEAPQHVLVAPSGEILVYLQSQPGISLDQFVGQPMGIDGERLRHPDLTPPMIVVERLTPVRF